MEFEYDPKKSIQNLGKHGISLEDAKQLWSGPMLIVDARHTEEERYIAVGKIGGNLYSCVYTSRGNKIRLISMRRSRKSEEKRYHEEEKSPKDN